MTAWPPTRVSSPLSRIGSIWKWVKRRKNVLGDTNPLSVSLAIIRLCQGSARTIRSCPTLVDPPGRRRVAENGTGSPPSRAFWGRTRWLPSSTVDISPKSSFRPNVGHGENGGPLDGAARARVKSAFATGLGETPFTGPLDGLLEGEFEDSGEVLQVDPRHPLAAASEFPPHPHAERREHLLQGASARIEHDSGADRRTRIPRASAAMRLLFPGDADFRRGSRCPAPNPPSEPHRRAIRSSR